MTTFIALSAFIIALIILVEIRTKSEGKYEIKIPDVVISLVPVVIWLVVSGKISELELGDLKVKLIEAYEKPVKLQISKLVEGKETISVGIDCSYGNDEDIDSLKTFPDYLPFKYILIFEDCEDDERGNADPKFWGLLTVDDYKRWFLSSNTKLSPSIFYDWVKSKNEKELERIIPSFVSFNNGIKEDASKLEALKIMEEQKVDGLPVLDKDNRLLGFVDRSRLTASFLIDIGETIVK